MSYTEEDIPKAWVVGTDVKPPTETLEAYSSTETVGADEAVSDAELVARGRSRANNRMKGRERGEGKAQTKSIAEAEERLNEQEQALREYQRKLEASAQYCFCGNKTYRHEDFIKHFLEKHHSQIK